MEIINIVEYDGMMYINTTPHPVNFSNPETGDEFVVSSCGILINARSTEKEVGEKNGIKLVSTIFQADPVSETALKVLEEEHPGAIIIGSIIAAQAYPGRVLAMTPCPGYERVAPSEKRMNPKKFTTFANIPA